MPIVQNIHPNYNESLYIVYDSVKMFFNYKFYYIIKYFNLIL